MLDMNSDHVFVVPDTPDQIKQSTCPVSSSVAMRNVDPSPCRKFRIKARVNNTHDPLSQADASRILPTHTDAENIFRQADVARTLAFPEDSEPKLPSQNCNKTAGTSLLNEKGSEKRVLNQSGSISNHIISSDAGERGHSCQTREGEVSQQHANHRNTNSLGVGSDLPTIPFGRQQSRTGNSASKRLNAVACPDVCPGSSSGGVKDEVINNMVIEGPRNPASIVPQRHVGQKRLVHGCISPSNIAKRSVTVDERQDMCSPNGFLHHPHPELDVCGAVNLIDLTDNSPTITGHKSTVNISVDGKDARAAENLRTDRAGKALVPPGYLANGSNCSGASLSDRNNKGKEISHDMLDNKRIGEANSRRVYLSSEGTSSVVNSSSSCVNPEQGWRTTHNHTGKSPILASCYAQQSRSSAPFNRDHVSADVNSSNSGATMLRSERLRNRTVRTAAGKQKLNSFHPDESSSALDIPRLSFQASSETTVGRYNTARRHNIPVVTIDDVLPEVGPSSGGYNNGASVDPTVQAQLESDELLARQLQEQLYNETSHVVPTEDIDAVIAISLQREENAYRTSRPVRRPQYNRRGAQGSRSNVYQNSGARTNNMISRRQNTASITLGLGAVFPRYSGAPHAQPNIDLNDYDSLLALDENNHQHTGASERLINSLPQSVVQSNIIEEPCAVCLDNPSMGDTIRHLPCFHKFHKDCIDQWLRRKKICPICKSGIR